MKYHLIKGGESVSHVKDLSGMKFNRWTVIKRGKNTMRGQATWLCRCDCGTIREVAGADLRNNKSKSCGCLQKEVAGDTNRTHGKSFSRLHRIWRGMKSRCENPKNFKASRYHDRGIAVCKEWHEFIRFYEWAVNNGYSDELSIDRIDNDKDYSPENCKWSNAVEQANNKSTNHMLTYKGKRQSMSMWSKEIGIPYGALRSRINQRHWSTEKALSTPLLRKRKG